MARRWHWSAIRGSVVYSLLVLFTSRCADVQEGKKMGDKARAPSSQSATSAQFELDVSGDTIKPVAGAQWYCEDSYIYEPPLNPSNVTPRPYDCSPPPPYEGPGVISKQCSSYQPGGECGGCWLTGSHPPNGTEETCYYEHGVSTSNCTTTGRCTLEKLKTKWFPSTMDNTGAFTIDQRTCAEGSVQVFENYMNYAFVNGVYVKVPDYLISRRTNQSDAFSLTVVNGGTRECKNVYELCQNGFSVVSFPSKTFSLDCSEVSPTPTVTPDPCAPSDGFNLEAGQCTPTPTATPWPLPPTPTPSCTEEQLKKRSTNDEEADGTYSLKASPELVRRLHDFEGYRERPYNDSRNNCTVGYGHKIHDGACKAVESPYTEMYKDMTAKKTTAEAVKAYYDQLFQQELEIAEGEVRRMFPKKMLSQPQFDALVDLAYNNFGLLRMLYRAKDSADCQTVTQIIKDHLDKEKPEGNLPERRKMDNGLICEDCTKYSK